MPLRTSLNPFRFVEEGERERGTLFLFFYAVNHDGYIGGVGLVDRFVSIAGSRLVL